MPEQALLLTYHGEETAPIKVYPGNFSLSQVMSDMNKEVESWDMGESFEIRQRRSDEISVDKITVYSVFIDGHESDGVFTVEFVDIG